MTNSRKRLGCAIHFILGFCCGALTIKIIPLIRDFYLELAKADWPPWLVFLWNDRTSAVLVLVMAALGCLLMGLVILYIRGRRS